MTPAQKTRVFLRVVQHTLDFEMLMYNDLDLYHASSECGPIVRRNAFKRLVRTYLQLGLTKEEFDREVRVSIALAQRYDCDRPFVSHVAGYAGEAVEIAEAIRTDPRRTLQQRLREHRSRVDDISRAEWGMRV